MIYFIYQDIKYPFHGLYYQLTGVAYCFVYCSGIWGALRDNLIFLLFHIIGINGLVLMQFIHSEGSILVLRGGAVDFVTIFYNICLYVLIRSGDTTMIYPTQVFFRKGKKRKEEKVLVIVIYERQQL